MSDPYANTRFPPFLMFVLEDFDHVADVAICRVVDELHPLFGETIEAKDVGPFCNVPLAEIVGMGGFACRFKVDGVESWYITNLAFRDVVS